MSDMKTTIYILRIAAVIGCALWIAHLLQLPSDYPLLGYAALIEFVLLLTMGNLICELWKLNIDSYFYRYVALPLYPIIFVFDCFISVEEFRPALDSMTA